MSRIYEGPAGYPGAVDRSEQVFRDEARQAGEPPVLWHAAAVSCPPDGEVVDLEMRCFDGSGQNLRFVNVSRRGKVVVSNGRAVAAWSDVLRWRRAVCAELPAIADRLTPEERDLVARSRYSGNPTQDGLLRIIDRLAGEPGILSALALPLDSGHDYAVCLVTDRPMSRAEVARISADWQRLKEGEPRLPQLIVLPHGTRIQAGPVAESEVIVEGTDWPALEARLSWLATAGRFDASLDLPRPVRDLRDRLASGERSPALAAAIMALADPNTGGVPSEPEAPPRFAAEELLAGERSTPPPILTSEEEQMLFWVVGPGLPSGLRTYPESPDPNQQEVHRRAKSLEEAGMLGGRRESDAGLVSVLWLPTAAGAGYAADLVNRPGRDNAGPGSEPGPQGTEEGLRVGAGEAGGSGGVE